MICEIELNKVQQLLIRQLESFFFRITKEERHLIDETMPVVLKKLEYNFSHNPNKYYHHTICDKEEAYFNPYHSGQWTIFSTTFLIQ